MSNRLLYRLDGFQYKGEGDVHTHAFNIHLDSDFARKALQKDLSDEAYKNMDEIGKDIIKRFNPKISSTETPYVFYNNQNGRSLLICFTRTIGNACELGIDGNDFGAFKKGWKDSTIVYSNHNIDTLIQQKTLLSLFVQWVDIAEALID